MDGTECLRGGLQHGGGKREKRKKNFQQGRTKASNTGAKALLSEPTSPGRTDTYIHANTRGYRLHVRGCVILFVQAAPSATARAERGGGGRVELTLSRFAVFTWKFKQPAHFVLLHNYENVSVSTSHWLE